MDELGKAVAAVHEIFEVDSLTRRALLSESKMEWEVSCPRSWFKFDTWTTGDALLLLAGISPTSAVIDWQDEVELVTGRVRSHVKFIEGGLVGSGEYEHGGWYVDMGRQYLTVEEVPRLLNKLPDDEKNIVQNIWRDREEDKNLSHLAQEYIKANMWLKVYSWAEFRLNRLYEFWISRMDADPDFIPDKRYPREYYIDWIKGKNLQEFVPWWKSALKHEFISDGDQAAPVCTKQELHPKKERTYLHIIGALLEITTGPFKDKTFENESRLKEFIVKKYKGFDGLSERTLSEKFSLAKKALNDEI